MKLFKHIKTRNAELDLGGLPWIPDDLTKSLAVITIYIGEAFELEVSRIGLYGSWQRGDATPESDVDLVVFLNHDVPWFDAKAGITSRLNSRKELKHWHAIEKTANAYRLDSRNYSIAVVTQAMLEYYALRGPIHLQNWVHALVNCHLLWEN